MAITSFRNKTFDGKTINLARRMRLTALKTPELVRQGALKTTVYHPACPTYNEPFDILAKGLKSQSKRGT